MRILWLKSDLLLPLDKGGKLRTWHLMRHLAARHEITYLAFADPDEDPANVQGMRAVASRVETIPRTDPPKGSLRFYLDAAVHLLDPLPYAVGKYRSRAYRRRLAALLKAQRFDLVVCDFLFPAVNLPRQLPCPAVIFTHNVESEIWRRHRETKTSFVGRLLYDAQHRRMRRYESRALARFDGVLAVSDADRQTFARLYPDVVRDPIHVVATGVDTGFFAPAEPASPAGSREIVFTGSMDWLPNEDAMIFFCDKVLPLIRAEEPDVRLSIVGRAPTPAVSKLADTYRDCVRVTGRVDDVRPYIAEAGVYIVPLRIGGGTRLKIFEAMAMAKAVVSTGVGAEGLPVEEGRHLILADEPNTFARAVVRLLRDVNRRRALEGAARALVIEKYDWSSVAGDLERALLDVADCGTRNADSAIHHAVNPQSAIRNPQLGDSL
ncbi:MAG TPA: glycosyltransferase [Vicinamibacterales bacterium]|nr:glycosyltransferase [Vicinamibacterales bacterium]